MTCAYSEAGGTLQRLELLKSAPSQRDNSLWHVHVARSHDQGMTMHLTELLAKKSALDEEIARAKKSEATVALRRVHELVTEFGLTVASRTIIWSLVKQVRVGLVPIFHGLHRRTALER